MKNKLPGIDLEGWIKTANRQGLPSRVISDGSLYYRHPLADNNSVVRFGARSNGVCLSCVGVPSGSFAGLGVRRVLRLDRDLVVD
jgi:hypothetical protein